MLFCRKTVANVKGTMLRNFKKKLRKFLFFPDVMDLAMILLFTAHSQFRSAANKPRIKVLPLQ